MSSEEQRGARGPQGDRKREGGVADIYPPEPSDMEKVRILKAACVEVIRKICQGDRSGDSCESVLRKALDQTSTVGKRRAFGKQGHRSPTAAQPARRK